MALGLGHHLSLMRHTGQGSQWPLKTPISMNWTSGCAHLGKSLKFPGGWDRGNLLWGLSTPSPLRSCQAGLPSPTPEQAPREATAPLRMSPDSHQHSSASHQNSAGRMFYI